MDYIDELELINEILWSYICDEDYERIEKEIQIEKEKRKMKHSIAQEIEDLKNEVDDLRIVIEVLECYVLNKHKSKIKRDIEEKRKELKRCKE